MENKDLNHNDIMPAVAYLTFIGLIIAIINNQEKKDELVAFHIRQSLGLNAASIAFMIFTLIPFLGWFIFIFGFIGLLILWIMGLISALNHEKKEVPIVGEKFDEWFKSF